MKIRNGFVSNSSSSSFIVIFDEDPRNNPAYLKRILYGDNKEIQYEYSYETAEYLSTDVLVEHILDAMKDKKPATAKEIVELLKHEVIPYDESPMYTIKDWRSDEYLYAQEAHDLRAFKLAMEQAGDFMKSAKDRYVFIMEFSDNDGTIGTQLEHGGTFSGLKHIRISHH